MANIRIRNLEDWVVETIRQIAGKNKRSMEEEMRTILREAASGPKKNLANLARNLREEIIREHGILPDSALSIREERDLRG